MLITMVVRVCMVMMSVCVDICMTMVVSPLVGLSVVTIGECVAAVGGCVDVVFVYVSIAIVICDDGYVGYVFLWPW